MTTETTDKTKALVEAVKKLVGEVSASTHSAHDVGSDGRYIRVMRASYVSRNVCQRDTFENVSKLMEELE